MILLFYQEVMLLLIPSSIKKSAPFGKYITKYDKTTLDDVEHLGLVMPIYNLL